MATKRLNRSAVNRRKAKSGVMGSELPTKGNVLLSDMGPFAKLSKEAFDKDIEPLLVGADGLADLLMPGLTKGKLRPAERAGLFIRAMRSSAGLSQGAVGNKAKIAQSEISAIENGTGEKGPTFDVLFRIAEACGYSVTFVRKQSVAEKRARAVVVAKHPVLGRSIARRSEPLAKGVKKVTAEEIAVLAEC